MVIRRKEAKDYGTKRLVEGSFRQGDTCLIIEDTVTSGTSILETAEVLCKEGLKVTDAVVLMDREQGGVEMLASKGIKLHPIISISQLLRVLQAAERIDAQTAQSVHKFIQDNNRSERCRKASGPRLFAHSSDELPGSLAAGEYTKAAVQMAEEHSDFVMGFICGSKLTERPEFIHMTPGVQMQAGGKSDCFC
ncbi:hypothetical protein ACER0C_002497 [Sarotherodon galilaeus]